MTELTAKEYQMLQMLRDARWVAPSCNWQTRALKSLVKRGYAKRLIGFTHIITNQGELQL